jgi:hypothetical protein
MKFRTEINIRSASHPIGYEKPVFMLGSCFTDNIGGNLRKYLFQTVINPFGVIYNPLSIKNSIEALLHREQYTEADLRMHKELWFSFDHYTKFSDPDKKNALDKINSAFIPARELFPSAGHLILTFGTAYIYQFKENGTVVNNCHKIPASEFNRRMVNVEEIVSSYREMIGAIHAVNPEMKIIFTVSPVRHLKDGFAGNMRSKSTLILAIRELENLFPGSCSYFPSYEVMMDDLRDYRYYGADLVHPNEQAIEYLWELFLKSFISKEAALLVGRLDPLLKSLNHRPRHADTEEFRDFREKTTEEIRKLKNEFPFLQWSDLE